MKAKNKSEKGKQRQNNCTICDITVIFCIEVQSLAHLWAPFNYLQRIC